VAALVLNLASLKLGQYTVITEDGRTAGDVLTYVSGLIANSLSTDKELESARTSAEKANHGDSKKIAAGEVPAGTVLYKGSFKDIHWGFDVPDNYTLYGDYPNPFNPATTIRYALPHRSQVLLAVYNTLGQKVVTLVQGEQEGGSYEVRFDGSALASGMYFYRLQAGSYVNTKKLLILR